MTAEKLGSKVASAVRVGILLVGATLWIFMIWSISRDTALDQAKLTSATNYYSEVAREEIDRTCVRLPSAAAANCAARVAGASREQVRAEYDLVAQQSMAWWTAFMAVVAAIGLTISVLGVFLVYATFKQAARSADAARDANKITRDLLEIENRPILAFDGCRLQRWSEENILLFPRWRNIGKLPAQPVTLETFRNYQQGNPTEEDIAALLERESQRQIGGHLLPSGEVNEGPAVMLRTDEIQPYDRFPAGAAPDAAELGLDRYQASRFAVVVARVTYKSAIGVDGQEWQSIHVLPVMPRFDHNRVMRDDEFQLGAVQNPVRMT